MPRSDKFSFGHGSPQLRETKCTRYMSDQKEPTGEWFTPLAPKPFGGGHWGRLHCITYWNLKNVFNCNATQMPNRQSYLQRSFYSAN